MSEVRSPPAEVVHRALVRLRVSMAAAPEAARRLALPGELRAARTPDHLALWLAPDQWLLAAHHADAASLIARCDRALEGLLQHAVDVTASLCCLSIDGPCARALLAMGSGLDWAHEATPPGFAARTRLAGIGAIVRVAAAEAVEVYVDRSLRDYFESWVRHAAADPLLQRRNCR